jgi:hypothetical protein
MPVESVIADAAAMVAQGGVVNIDHTATFLLGTDLTRPNRASADLTAARPDVRG